MLYPVRRASQPQGACVAAMPDDDGAGGVELMEALVAATAAEHVCLSSHSSPLDLPVAGGRNAARRWALWGAVAPCLLCSRVRWSESAAPSRSPLAAGSLVSSAGKLTLAQPASLHQPTPPLLPTEQHSRCTIVVADAPRMYVHVHTRGAFDMRSLASMRLQACPSS